MLDLLDYKVGDLVTYANGYVGHISSFSISSNTVRTRVYLEGPHKDHTLDGKNLADEKWSIVHVKPPEPIDLSKTQPGDTVIYANGNRGVFVGRDINHPLCYKSRSGTKLFVHHTKPGKCIPEGTHPLDIVTVLSSTSPKPPQPMRLPTAGITDTRPTIEDADGLQNVQVLTSGGWALKRWDCTDSLPWVHTPKYKLLTKEDLALQLSNNLKTHAAPSNHLLKLTLNYLQK